MRCKVTTVGNNQGVVQMIFNEHLDRLMEVDVVQNFTKIHRMKGKMCSEGKNHTYILYRLPYVVGFWDSVIENYLEIVLVDLDAELLIEGGSALGCSLDMGLQKLEILRQRNFSKHLLNEIFLSERVEKMRYLHSHLEAFEKILPLIECKEGLISMKDGSFDSRFNFSDSVKPIYPGLKERYQKCIGSS